MVETLEKIANSYIGKKVEQPLYVLNINNRSTDYDDCDHCDVDPCDTCNYDPCDTCDYDPCDTCDTDPCDASPW